ncbi:hypothetical protein ScPMuIL_013959 [Solemya velum]
MAIYMPPIARKKRVSTRYNPDTFRVISVEAEDSHPIQWPPVQGQRELPSNPILTNPDWNSVKGKPQVLPHPVDDYRGNRPHPTGCGFLRHNVALLNEPVCTVHTNSTHIKQDQWWPSRTSNEPLKVPPYAKDTIYREDFHVDKERSSITGFSRHSSNPNKEAVLGVVPVNFLRPRDGSKRLYNEKISFEHLYNCRTDPNYPVRAKRHGSFVWQNISPQKAEEMIAYHAKLDEEEASGFSANVPKLNMSPESSSRKGSPKVLSPIRSSTFVNQLPPEKLPQSPSKPITSECMQALPQEAFNRTTSFINKENLPQSPVRSLTSVELQQISRRSSNTSAFKPKTATYTVIPSVAECPEQLISGKSGPQNSPTSAPPLSRKRTTPLQTPLSGPIRTDKPALPTSVEVNTTMVTPQLNNCSVPGSSPTRRVSHDQSIAVAPAEHGDSLAMQEQMMAQSQMAKVPSSVDACRDVSREASNIGKMNAQESSVENDMHHM